MDGSLDFGELLPTLMSAKYIPKVDGSPCKRKWGQGLSGAANIYNYAVSFATGQAEVTCYCWRGVLTHRIGRCAGRRLGLLEISVTLQGGPADSVENIFGLKVYYKDC